MSAEPCLAHTRGRGKVRGKVSPQESQQVQRPGSRNQSDMVAGREQGREQWGALGLSTRSTGSGRSVSPRKREAQRGGTRATQVQGHPGVGPGPQQGTWST